METTQNINMYNIYIYIYISGKTEGLSRDLLTSKFRVATHQNKYLSDIESTKQSTLQNSHLTEESKSGALCRQEA